MNNQKIVLYVVLATVVLVFGVYLFPRGVDDKKMVVEPTPVMEKTSESGLTMEKIEPVMKKVESKEEPTGIMMVDQKVENPRYVEYDKDRYVKLTSARKVLFFYANWCQTCVPADADFKKNSAMIPNDVTVVRVNYNDPDTDQSEKDLSKQYGVVYQHTFVQIDSAGKVVAKWNGGQTKELVANVK